jgi:hypothetical protein
MAGSDARLDTQRISQALSQIAKEIRSRELPFSPNDPIIQNVDLKNWAFRVGEQAQAVQALTPQDGWQPIETAPERRKVLVTGIDALGKRRTTVASYWPEGTLDMADDVPDWQQNDEGTNLDAGWWEESEGNDDAMFRLTEVVMTHWMALPSPPKEEPTA